MEIRWARKEDVERICEITAEAWETYSMYRLMEDRYGWIGDRGCRERKAEDLRQFCEAHLDRVFVAVEEGTVVGYATFGVDLDDGIGSVTNNAVDPRYQRRGIGTALNRRVLDHFRELGLRIARVTTLEHDMPARRIYEKHGFQEIARSVHYTMEL